MTDQVQAAHILLMYQGSDNSTATRSKEEALEEIQARIRFKALSDRSDSGVMKIGDKGCCI